MVTKELLGKTQQGERKNYQPDFAIFAEVQNNVQYGDKVFVSWKGSTPVVMNKVIDTEEEEIFEEDEENNDYLIKIKDNDIEVFLEKCVQKENKVYVSLEEILQAYDKVDNDNLSWKTRDIPYYI